MESFEDDLSSILRDESDADIVELLKTTIRRKNNVPCTPEIISSKPDESDLDELEHYGNTVCRFFKWRVQIWKYFCLKINMPKGNY